MALTLLLNALLVVSFFSLGIARQSGGDEGMWAVMLFWLLIIPAPLLLVVTIWRYVRRWWAA